MKSITRRTVLLLLGIPLFTSECLAEVPSPLILARFDESQSAVRTLFLYSDQPLRAVYVFLHGTWVAARPEASSAHQEEYHVYRVAERFAPSSTEKLLLNSWSEQREQTYRHELSAFYDGVDFQVRAELKKTRSREEFEADASNQSAAQPAGFTVPPESRALIEAVRRTGARSVQGRLDPEIVQMALRYAQKMARQGRQDGHAGWSGRFQYLLSQGGGGGMPSEITAESWNFLGESLETHAQSCVESWLQSPGHRADMMKFHGRYGYAMARGRNGVYYAVGIFAN